MRPSRRTVTVIVSGAIAGPVVVRLAEAYAAVPSWVGTIVILPPAFLLGMYLHELDKLPDQLTGPPEGHDG